MTTGETTGERPTDYSTWHRNELPGYCTAQDIDWVEYRIKDEKPIPVAIIETGRWNRSKFKDFQVQIAKTIAEKLEIPVYFVEYFIDEENYYNNRFKVIKLNNGNKEIVLRNEEYKEFLKNLKKV